MDESAPVEASAEPSVDPSVATVEAPVEAPKEAPKEAPVKAASVAEQVARDQVEFDEGEPSEGDEGMGAEAVEELERQRKLEKRAQRKMQQEKLDKHFREEEIGATVDTGAEEVEEEQEKEKEKEPEKEVKLQRKTIEALQSFVLDDEEFRTGVSSDSEDTEYMKDEPGSSFKDDFMQNFYFPSMSDCSTPSSDHILARLAATDDKASTKDKTKTTDTTREGSSTSLVDEHAAGIYEDEHMGEGDDDDDESSTSSSILSWPCALDNISTVVAEVKKEDSGMDMFLEMHTEEKVKKESVSKLEAARRALEIAEIVNVFLNNTIDDAVNAALYMGPGKAFTAKVSLPKLYDLLYDAVESYILVKQFNKDINAKMFEYYRRIGQMRVFDQLSPRLTRVEHDRFKEALYQLDYLKERAVMTKKTNAALLSSVRLDLEHVFTIAQASDESLEECMRKTINRKDALHLPRIIEVELNRMRAIRNEISDSRIWLITRQHTLGRILEVRRGRVSLLTWSNLIILFVAQA